LNGDDELKNFPDCLRTIDAALPVASDSDQFPVSSNPNAADGTAGERRSIGQN